MTDSAPLKATLKAGPGYEAPWITVEASTPAELTDRLNGLASGGTFNALTEASKTLLAQYSLGATIEEIKPDEPVWATRATDPAYAQPQAPQPPQEPAPQQGAGPSCPHGAMVWKQGTGKASGKPYKGWFCPQNQRGCEPHFIR